MKSLKHFLGNSNTYTKWQRYAVDALPYLLDCAQNQKTITYSELGEILHKNGITEKCYAGRRVAQYVGWIVGQIGDYCQANKLPLLNVLVVNAASKLPGKGAYPFIEKSYNTKITPALIKGTILPEIFSYNWDECCKINGINIINIINLPEAENLSIAEQKYLRQHIKNESVGRIGAAKVKQMKQEKAKSLGGYKCEICGFSFSEHYGDLGQEFIELHHLSMYKNMKNGTSRKLTEKDFAILCSNCHRMIHKLPHPKNNKTDIERMKKIYKK